MAIRLTVTQQPGESPATVPETFGSFYLRKVTLELQDDLDKVRSAGDFNQASLSTLITALQQGESTFSQTEKDRIMMK